MLTALYLEQLMQSTVNYFKNEGLEDNDMSHISLLKYKYPAKNKSNYGGKNHGIYLWS